MTTFEGRNLLPLVLAYFQEHPDRLTLMRDIIERHDRHGITIKQLQTRILHTYRKQRTSFGNKPFYIHDEYRTMVNLLGQKCFDFNRRENSGVSIEPLPQFRTTLAQMTFFKWLFESGTYDFVVASLQTTA